MFFGGSGLFVLFVSLLFRFFTAFVLSYQIVSLTKNNTLSRNAAWTLIGVLFAFLFSSVQSQDFCREAGIYGSIAFAALALGFQAHCKRFDRYFWISCICALLGTYSMGQGLLIWPILIAFSLFNQRKGKQIWALIAFTFLAVFLYLLPFGSLNSENSNPNLIQIKPTFQYLLYFLGNSFNYNYYGDEWVVGLICLTLLLGVFFSFLEKRFQRQSRNECPDLFFIMASSHQFNSVGGT